MCTTVNISRVLTLTDININVKKPGSWAHGREEEDPVDKTAPVLLTVVLLFGVINVAHIAV